MTDALIDFINLRNAVMIVGAYALVLGAYLVDELGLRDFPRWYSRMTLSLFAAASPVFLLLAMVFTFLWGFRCC
ncbi:MAG: hypothetical protein IT429_21690 [Gemmataceae bacterium]|nr:hypothetical protein [Gemmataceae bacterium]